MCDKRLNQGYIIRTFQKGHVSTLAHTGTKRQHNNLNVGIPTDNDIYTLMTKQTLSNLKSINFIYGAYERWWIQKKYFKEKASSIAIETDDRFCALLLLCCVVHCGVEEPPRLHQPASVFV